MESTTATHTSDVHRPDSDGYLTMMGNLFIAPNRTFLSLALKPRWFIPFLLCVLAAISFEGATSKYRMADLRERIQQDETLSREEVQRRMGNIDAQRTTSIDPRQLAIGATLLTVLQGVKLFSLAFIVWLALQLYPTRVNYLRILAACSFIFLVTIPEQLLKGALIVAKGSYRVFLGPAALLPAEWFESPLFNALNRVDVFSLWMAILLIIALSAIAGISRTRAIVTVGYLWVLWLLEGAFLGGLVRVS